MADTARWASQLNRMPTTHIADLDRLLNRWILAAADPLPAWKLKCRAKRLLSVSRDPERLAGRMLQVLTQQQITSKAA
jgi:hypothetical protein